MIRCVRIWTGDDQNSHVEEGWIDLKPGAHGDLLSGKIDVTSASLQETQPGGTYAWHTAPVRQLVITLSGTLDFVDNTVDPQIGTVRAKAVFANADQSLWPGQFVGTRITV
eukprot:gene4696-6000_t